jgi:hypothetical protein
MDAYCCENLLENQLYSVRGMLWYKKYLKESDISRVEEILDYEGEL